MIRKHLLINALLAITAASTPAVAVKPSIQLGYVPSSKKNKTKQSKQNVNWRYQANRCENKAHNQRNKKGRP